MSSRPTRATFPPADRVGLRYSLSDTRNVVTSCLRPSGRLTVRHADGGMGRDDGRSESHPVMGWIRIESLRARHHPARKGADVRLVLRCEKAGRTILRGKANEATLCEPCALYPNGDWLPACIAKVIGSFDHRVTSIQRLAFEGLEPYDGKLSRTVLRGERGRKAPDLPGLFGYSFWSTFVIAQVRICGIPVG